MSGDLKHSVRRPKGTIIIAGDVEATFDTLQCCHCGKHWQVKPGSGHTRGFCTRCMGPTCGDQQCDDCLPFEKRLDLYERGKLKKL